MLVYKSCVCGPSDGLLSPRPSCRTAPSAQPYRSSTPCRCQTTTLSHGEQHFCPDTVLPPTQRSPDTGPGGILDSACGEPYTVMARGEHPTVAQSETTIHPDVISSLRGRNRRHARRSDPDGPGTNGMAQLQVGVPRPNAARPCAGPRCTRRGADTCPRGPGRCVRGRRPTLAPRPRTAGTEGPVPAPKGTGRGPFRTSVAARSCDRCSRAAGRREATRPPPPTAAGAARCVAMRKCHGTCCGGRSVVLVHKFCDWVAHDGRWAEAGAVNQRIELDSR